MNKTVLMNLFNSPTFASIFDSMPVGICIVDISGIVLCWNTLCEKIQGKKKSKVVGKNINEVFVNSVLQEILTKKSQDKLVNYYVSEKYNVVMTVSGIQNEQGETIGYISIEQDITAYNKLNQMLEDAQRKIALLNGELNKITDEHFSFEHIIGVNPQFVQQIELSKNIAKSKVSVLIEGESGTGKELIAKAIHKESRRKGQMISINCSAIPYNLFESELFGYEKGSFTGAEKAGKIGLIEASNQGTLFLDEIGEMPMEMQPKLLRVLESCTVKRIGGIVEKPLDLRVICATNENLEQLIDEKKFRLDLYFRICGVNIKIPPLRKRTDDILALAEHYQKEFGTKYGVKDFDIPADILAKMKMFEWAGNARELRNYVERLVILDTCGKGLDAFPSMNFEKKETEAKIEENQLMEGSLKERMEQYERDLIAKTIDSTKGSITKAAGVLGIPRTSLYYKMNKYGIGK